MNNLVNIIESDGTRKLVCLTPEVARLMDGWLADQMPTAQESDHKAIQRLRDELKPVYTPELAYAEWGAL